MIKIIDTYLQFDSVFENGIFSLAKWEFYINTLYDGASNILIDDMKSANYEYEKDVLPIINDVYRHPALMTLHSSFCNVTDDLNLKIVERFGHELDIDIVLYIGLCSAAGWVTNINGRDVILLGIEKILELNWYDEDSMRGLIYHELGHIYHKQYGVYNQHSDNSKRNFVWQLFTEGIAMYFEQALVDNFNYYHQDKNGWLEWCDNHYQQIRADFDSDLQTMTRTNQRFFGDWVSYNGKGDVGYYLGTRFVQQLCDKYDFQHLINLEIDDIFQEYLSFTKMNSHLRYFKGFNNGYILL